jgi:hypothetical protein
MALHPYSQKIVLVVFRQINYRRIAFSKIQIANESSSLALII